VSFASVTASGWGDPVDPCAARGVRINAGSQPVAASNCSAASAMSCFLASPFGTRGSHKSDPLKPHWNGADDLRFPTMDHHWPVSLYADNRPKNLKVLCNACNQGKEDFLANEQLRPAVGLPRRSQLLSGGALPFDVF
jgi:hypothetical protein